MKTTRQILLLLPLALFAASCANQPPKPPELTDKVSFDGSLAESLIEGRRTVSGQVTVNRGDFDSLTVQDGESAISVSLPLGRKAPAGIDPSRTYRVELLTRIFKEPSYTFNDLLRISLDGRVIRDESICHIHHRSMERQLEEGVSAENYPDAFLALQKRRFPNDGYSYLFCGSGIRHPVWKCPACHEACLRAEKRYNIIPE